MPTSILDDAAAIVDGDREQTYGDPGANLRAIANLWDSWLLARGWSGPGLQVEDVALMMALLKIARLARSPAHRDSLVDIAGYARLLERCQQGQTESPGADPPTHPGGEGEGGGGGDHSPISPPPAPPNFGQSSFRDSLVVSNPASNTWSFSTMPTQKGGPHA